MTIQDLIQLLDDHALVAAAALILVPLLAVVAGWLHPRRQGGGRRWRYLYSVLIYLASLPGVFAATLTGYTLLLRNDDLTAVSVVVYFLPIATMLATFWAVRRNVRSLDELPGFDRLSGLMVILAVSFLVAFVIQRLRFGVLFLAPLFQVGLVVLGLFFALKWGERRLFGKSRRHRG